MLTETRPTADEPSDNDTAIDAWMKQAVGRDWMSVDVMAEAMQADGFGAPEAHVLAAVGVLRHDAAPLRAVLQSSRLQGAAWNLIRHFGQARHDAATESVTMSGRAALAAPLSPRRANGHRTLSDGREVDARLSCSRPELVLFDNVLSSEECAGLIELARGRLVDSEVMTDAGDVVDRSARSSCGTFLVPGSAALLETVEARVAELVEWPLDYMEELAVTRYGPGEQFVSHWDFFDDAKLPSHGQALASAGQRIATVVLYLSEVAQGGATTFAFAGLEVRPKQGSVLYFAYQMPDGGLDPASLHGGAPVLDGEKWIATLWLREKPISARGERRAA